MVSVAAAPHSGQVIVELRIIEASGIANWNEIQRAHSQIDPSLSAPQGRRGKVRWGGAAATKHWH
jgi:hypothetical protein